MKFKSLLIIVFVVALGLGAGLFFYNKQTPNFGTQSLSSEEVSKPKDFKNILTLKTLDQLDSSKPTVCNITINSDEEKQVFNSSLKND